MPDDGPPDAPKGSAPMRSAPTAFLLGAPTASGKSTVALRLAERLGLEIVVADAMQVYRGLDVGTAKPTAAERARVPHHALDLVTPDQPFSVAAWADVAETAILDAAARGVACLVVGGTGFYLHALSEGLPTTPPADPDAQAPIWAELERDGLDALHDAVAAVSPEDAARAARNPRRLVRTLEVIRTTGRPPSAFPFRPPRVRVDRTWLLPEMAALEPRIEARADAMLAAGWVEEAAALDAASLDPAALHPAALATARQAIGYVEAAAVARGEMSVTAAREAIVAATRRYARRQRTWFRKHAAERRLEVLAAEAEPVLAAWLEGALEGQRAGALDSEREGALVRGPTDPPS